MRYTIYVNQAARKRFGTPRSADRVSAYFQQLPEHVRQFLSAYVRMLFESIMVSSQCHLDAPVQVNVSVSVLVSALG